MRTELNVPRREQDTAEEEGGTSESLLCWKGAGKEKKKSLG